MEVYLIRHTSVDIDSNVCYGQSDVSLSSTFEEEAQKIRQELNIDFEKVYSSPLSRCTLLSNKFSTSVETDTRLLEINFGEWEGKKWDVIHKKELELWMKEFIFQRPPNGENLQNMYLRVSNFLEELRTKNFKSTLIITHSGVIRCMLADILQISLQNIFKFEIRYGRYIHLNLSKDRIMDRILA